MWEPRAVSLLRGRVQVGNRGDKIQLLEQPLSYRIQNSFDRFHWRLNRCGGTKISRLLDNGDSLVVYAKNHIIGEGRESSKLLTGVSGESLAREECVP